LKSEHLSVNIKLTFYKALIRSIIAYAYPAWGFAADSHVLKLQRLQSPPHHFVIYQGAHRPAICMWCSKFRTFYTILLKKTMHTAGNSHTKSWKCYEVRNIGQGEAQHRKYKRLKLAGGQADDCSSV